MKTKNFGKKKVKIWLKNIKKPIFGNNRSFSNRSSSRKFKLNKQKGFFMGIRLRAPVSLIKKKLSFFSRNKTRKLI